MFETRDVSTRSPLDVVSIYCIVLFIIPRPNISYKLYMKHIVQQINKQK